MSPRPNIKFLLLGQLLIIFCCGGCTPTARFAHEFGGIASADHSEAHVPTGMRRTVNGWEDASDWDLAINVPDRPIEHWIARQELREPGWARRLFAKIRKTPPLMIAVVQIAAIAAIIHISRSQVTAPGAD